MLLNPYVDAHFRNFTTFRNKVNGVQVSRVAHLILERFKIADNIHAGVEWPGAQGGLLLGPWGKNVIRDSLIVGHSDPRHVNLTHLMGRRLKHSTTGAPRRLGSNVRRRLVNSRHLREQSNRRLGGGGGLSSGMEGPAYHGLTVDNVTFANFDHPLTVAMTALAKESFTPGGGGWEVRFQNIHWDNAFNRIKWDHPHESVFVDVDGTFTGLTPGTSCVPWNALLDSFESCVVDERYGRGNSGRVCPKTRFVRVAAGGETTAPTVLKYKQLMVGYSNGKTFVKAHDSTYLYQKWRQEGEPYLIEMKTDAATPSQFVANPVGKLGLGYWTSAQGVLSPTVNMVFDEADGTQRTRVGTVAKDLSMILWKDASSNNAISGFKTWHNCEIEPTLCVAAPQPQYDYPEMSVDYHLKRRTIPKGHVFTVPVGKLYEFRWNLAANERADVETFAFDFSDVTEADQIWMRTQYQVKPDHFDIDGVTTQYYLPNTNNTAVPGKIPSLDPTFQKRHGTWSWNDQQSSVSFLLGGVHGTVSSSFVADPCPLNGCPDPAEKFSVAHIVRWSHRSTWNGSVSAIEIDKVDPVTGLPTDGSTVTMASNATVLFDVIDTPILKVLHIRGTLHYEDVLNANRSLNAINIVVRGTGNLTMDCQISYSCEVVLHGDRFTKGVTAGGSSFGAKGLVVFGEVNMRGPPRISSWSKLHSHVEIGSTSVIVANPGDFKQGDKIVISATAYNPSHAEVKFITHVSGSVLSVDSAFAHRHRCDGGTGVVCGEVGLLSRAVRIRGGNSDVADSFHSLYEHEFGATVTVTRRASVVDGKAVWENGHVHAENVGFYDCGQAGFDDRHCLYFARGLGAGGGLSSISHVSFDYMFNAAVSIGNGVSGVRVENCVGFKSLGSMFVVKQGAGPLNAIVKTLSVLVMTRLTHRGAALRSNLNNVDWEDYPANFDLHEKGIFVDNVAAGSERLGFKGYGGPCSGGTESWQWDRNEAHTTSIGSATLGNCPDGMCYNNFKGYVVYFNPLFIVLLSSFFLSFCFSVLHLIYHRR